jgi:predicted GIY-YIG superfamily endonuclease
MTFVVYGLRIRGDKEIRYIGHSADMNRRLAGHISNSKQMPWATKFATWLRENAPDIEAVQLDVAETRDEARKLERKAVAFCLALDHNIFNQWLVPSERRITPREGDEGRRPLWVWTPRPESRAA